MTIPVNKETFTNRPFRILWSCSNSTQKEDAEILKKKHKSITNTIKLKSVRLFCFITGFHWTPLGGSWLYMLNIRSADIRRPRLARRASFVLCSSRCWVSCLSWLGPWRDPSEKVSNQQLGESPGGVYILYPDLRRRNSEGCRQVGRRGGRGIWAQTVGFGGGFLFGVPLGLWG